MRLRDDIFAQDTMYTEYVVQNGERPEQIAYEEYGDEEVLLHHPPGQQRCGLLQRLAHV